MDEIDALILDVIVDADDEDEQLLAFCQAFDDRARLPIAATIVGVEVAIVAVDLQGWERQGLTAVCRREGRLHRVSLLDLVPVEPLDPATRRLIDAYRRWAGTPALPEPAPPTAWVYPRFAASSTTAIAIDEPLRLTAHGTWNPATEYWGEPGDGPLHPLLLDVIAAGPRPRFEMEQVLPGVDPDDDLDDLDPIVDAADLLDAGLHREAVRLLEGVIELDPRCVDAWAHLGLIEFRRGHVAQARRHYELGVAVAETALPPGFAGVLPRGLIDNRPFRRALHGLGLCAWRQRRWDEAQSIFVSLVWLDPGSSYDALACLDQVTSRTRWSSHD
ncbi:MAG: tetratricopeptide repeat protein [Acidimicrobiales bacterium]|nr:tetratricopeptide repeat protein [Acidimicrobiales bacterium]MCB9392583.1 tetratricopeptide repeat protein [Acidimicrobiaceae bacterium]